MLSCRSVSNIQGIQAMCRSSMIMGDEFGREISFGHGNILLARSQVKYLKLRRVTSEHDTEQFNTPVNKCLQLSATKTFSVNT